MSHGIELSRVNQMSRGIELSRGNIKCWWQAGYITKEYQYKPDDAEAINQRVVIKYINEVRDRVIRKLMTLSQFDDVILEMYSYFLLSSLGSKRRLYFTTILVFIIHVYFLVKWSNDYSSSRNLFVLLLLNFLCHTSHGFTH